VVPYSSAVRQRLTELGIDYVAKQVAPRQEEREGEHEIPLLVTEDGERLEGTDAVFEYLATLESSLWERGHRAQYRAHRDDRADERKRACSPNKFHFKRSGSTKRSERPPAINPGIGRQIELPGVAGGPKLGRRFPP
jgi:hypothetical protein